MNYIPDKDLLAQLVETVRRVGQRPAEVRPNTKILVDLDFDSLLIIELLEEVRRELNCDLSRHPNLIQVLHSPTTLTYAVEQVLAVRKKSQ